jgi:hypothetical protein
MAGAMEVAAATADFMAAVMDSMVVRSMLVEGPTVLLLTVVTH